MNYNIKTTGLALSDEIRTYIEKRLVHVDTLLKDDTTAHTDVEIQQTQKEEHEKFRAEFTLQSGGMVYRAESFGESLHAAIDLSTAALTHEVTKAKKKNHRLLRRGSIRIKEFIRGFKTKV